MVAVGAVNATSARIWARSDRPGVHRLTLTPDGGATLEHEVVVADGLNDLTGAWTIRGLAPATRYRYELRGVGGGRFVTAPDASAGPQTFSFGVMSCHAPFDADGNVRDGALAMLRAAHAALTGCDARFVLPIGDQIYADYPPRESVLADPGVLQLPREAIRARYHAVYRRYWSMPELQALYADFPSWPMLDDHDLVNNFGSLEEHALPEWQALRAGSLDAYYDYQASRVIATSGERPATFDHGFRWSQTAVYQLDIRSARYATPDGTQLVTPEQIEAMREFLRANRDARVLVLGVSVPIAYVPTWFSALAAMFTEEREGADRWSYSGSLPDRDRVLGALLEQAAAAPHQRVVLVSGDIHVGTALEIAWKDGPVFHQLTSSAITNDVGMRKGAIFELVAGIERTIHCGDRVAHVSRIAGEPDANPYGFLNIGLVHVDEGQGRVRFELVGTRDGTPGTAFLSPWL